MVAIKLVDEQMFELDDDVEGDESEVVANC